MSQLETVNIDLPMDEQETVNIHGHTVKLSRLQKIILNSLQEITEQDREVHKKISVKNPLWSIAYPFPDPYLMHSKFLSWHIAKNHQGENYLSREEIIENHKITKLKTRQEMKDNPELLNFFEYMWSKRRYIYPLLQPSFRASLSRSLRRLEKRGLISRMKEESRYSWSKSKTTQVYLTKLGQQVAKELR